MLRRLSRVKRVTLVLFLVFVALYLAWGELIKVRGAQRVTFAPASVECASAGQARYCIYTADGSTNGDILYHLHGRNLDETVWNDDTYYTAMLQEEWQRSGKPAPTIVSVSYGGTWLLTPAGVREDSGLLEDFFKLVETVERRSGKPDRRLLLGESMGGLNVLVAGFSRPDSFAKVASLCPGVYVNSPFDPLEEQVAGLRRTGADPKTVFGVAMLARKYVADDREWARVSPLRLIEQVEPAQLELYLSNGLYDKFGNFEGSERLAEVARARGIKTEWHPLYGGHCSIDVRSLSAFLVT